MELEEYLEIHSDGESELLKEVARETHLKTLRPRMLSGHLQGRFLKMLCSLSGAERVLEVGTFTGYAALSMAEAMPENGKVITIDINDELEEMVSGFISRSPYRSKIEFIVGDACKILPELDEVLDLVFIDGDKRAYTDYYDLVFDKVRPGGLIVADDVLWNGKVLEEKENYDSQTEGIVAFNKKVLEDNRVEKVMLPFRHGLYLIRKK